MGIELSFLPPPVLALLLLIVGALMGAAIATYRTNARLRGESDGQDAAQEEIRDHLHALEIERARLDEQIGARDRELAETRDAVSRHIATLEARDREIGELRTNVARFEQERESFEQRRKDAEEANSNFLHMARSSITQLVNETSTKLLNDHKKESETAGKQAEERNQKLTEDLMKQVGTLSEKVQHIGAQSNKNAGTLDILSRALSSPGTAGHAAQTSLGNVLKSFGLTEGRDFELEHTVAGDGDGRLRPDAVVFLPGETILVIDSKSSKHLWDMAEAESDAGNDTDIAAATDQFKRSMGKHLKDLAAKDYRDAVAAAYRDGKNGHTARQVITLMWLPNEAAVEKLANVDPQFSEKAAENRIFVAGPSGLWSAIGIAETRIRFARQQESLQHIADDSAELIKRLGVALSHVDKLGKSITQSAKHFDKMSGSINSSVIPSLRKLTQHGVQAPAKGLPDKLPRIQVLEDAIDAEAEEVTDTDVEETRLLFSPEE